MHIVRDVLDKLVVDRLGHEMGRVDGIRLERVEHQPLRFASILMGPPVLGSRLSRFSSLIGALTSALGLDAREPVEVPVADITKFAREIVVGKRVTETGAARMEGRLRALLGAGNGPR
jgi:hypothetical protein